MAAGQTTITTTLGGISKSISGGQDASSNFVPGHTLFDINGAVAGTASNPITVKSYPAAPATSALTNVASSVTSVSLLAANTARLRYSVFNDSTAVVYVREGSGTASSTSYSFQVAAGGYFSSTEWGGAVSAIWVAANGNARITEYTA